MHATVLLGYALLGDYAGTRVGFFSRYFVTAWMDMKGFNNMGFMSDKPTSSAMTSDLMCIPVRNWLVCQYLRTSVHGICQGNEDSRRFARTDDVTVASGGRMVRDL